MFKRTFVPGVSAGHGILLPVMEEKISDYIERFDMRSFLNDRLIDGMEIFRIPRHQTLILEKSQIRYLYFLVEGQLSCIHYNFNGNIDVMAITKPLTVIGDVELLDEQPSSTAVTTGLDSVLLGIRIDRVRRFGLEDPRFLRFIIMQLSAKIRRSTILRYGSSLPVKSRFAFFILAHYGEAADGVIILPDKDELASMLGTSTRHLNRIIREFIKAGAVGKGYPGMRISDISVVRKMADETLPR